MSKKKWWAFGLFYFFPPFIVWNKDLFVSEVHMNSLSTAFLSPVGIRVLHSVLGESGIPAQHCQKVHRPEVCPTGELSSHFQNSAFLLHHLLYCQFCFFISFFAFKFCFFFLALCFFLPYSLKLIFLPPHLCVYSLCPALGVVWQRGPSGERLSEDSLA